MDLFQKCSEFTMAREAQAMGLYPYFHCMESGQDPAYRDYDRCDLRELSGCPSPGYKAPDDKLQRGREGGTSHGDERKGEQSCCQRESG